MKTTLVGYTGFVGGNLAASHSFDLLYNSKNITDAFSQKHGLLIYSGVRAEKFLANADPDADMAVILNAIENIKKLCPERIVLISTADVYKTPDNVDENTVIDKNGLAAYGRDRLFLEEWVAANIKKHHIIRLPGLYGRGIKKNFLYDIYTVIPAMLKKEKFTELCGVFPLCGECYAPAENGFYRLCVADGEKKQKLKSFFEQNSFNALSFTDSRAEYQFYNLSFLWRDINTVIENDIPLINLTAEPLCAAEVYRYITGREFKNEISQSPVKYNLKSVYSGLFGGCNGYMYTKEQTLESIKKAVLSGFTDF